MILNLVLGGVLVVISTLIGVKLGEKYKLRRDIYCELAEFCERINTNIQFKKDTVDKLKSAMPNNVKKYFGKILTIMPSD